LNELDLFIKKFGGLTEEYKFYNGEEILRYDPIEHVYFLVTPAGLERLSGVTNTCHIIDKSDILMNWACKMMGQKLEQLLGTVPLTEAINQAKKAHKDVLEDAGAVGHKAHGWIETYIKDQLNGAEFSLELVNPPEDDRAKSACTASLDFMRKHNVRWRGTERKIYSRTFKYAGTMDGLCLVDSCNDPSCCKHEFKDHLAIIDWKTSNYLYLEFRLQTAAYQYAYEEETGEVIQDRFIIRLGKDDAEFEMWHLSRDQFEMDMNGFLACLALVDSIEEIETDIKEGKENVRKHKRAEKAIAKEAALRVACAYSSKYKGTRKPKCNGGNPCEACLAKYELHQIAKQTALAEKKQATRKIKEPKNSLKKLQKALDNSV
jgi:hypothetical protein